MLYVFINDKNSNVLAGLSNKKKQSYKTIFFGIILKYFITLFSYITKSFEFDHFLTHAICLDL